MKKTVYYAHFMGIYNTPQEKRDILTLQALGLEVINPNTPIVQDEVETQLRINRNDPTITTEEEAYMKMFDDVFFSRVRSCDVFAFRPLPDGRIPGGVFMELKEAQKENKIIIELPCGTHARGMGKEDTREYLKDIGQR